MIRKRLIAPEVIQVSAMDCGPASLKCFLDGAGVSVSYGRLREACQTDLDGTSIDTLEEVAVELGVDAEQVIVPAEHLLIAEARTLPAIVVISLPNGGNHFVVLWRLHGRFVQIMDPATGRRLQISHRFLNEIYIHRFPVPGDAWRAWAGSDELTAPLRRRMGLVGVKERRAAAIIREALEDPSWRSIAALDAATRMVESMARSGGLSKGRESSRLLQTLFEKSVARTNPHQLVPEAYWSVSAAPESGVDGDILITRGAVVVRSRGAIQRKPASEPAVVDDRPRRHLSPELMAALEDPPARPLRELVGLLEADGVLIPFAIVLGLFASAFGVVFEALLFRGLLGIGRELGLPTQRLEALGALLIFAASLLVLELPLTAGLLRIGRRLETRLRLLFLEKLPRLGDRYFQSRLTSDMAERGHSLYLLRLLPGMAGQLIRLSFTLVLTTAGVCWLDPPSAPLAIFAAITGLVLPLLTQPLLAESDLRVRTHLAGLSRFYLDALLGLVPIRTHGAERAIRREHEGLLVEWTRSSLKLQRRVLAVDALQSMIALGLTCWIVFGYAARAGDAGNSLLLIYWALSLPALGQQLAFTALQYPAYRNVVLRLLEPLGAPDDGDIIRMGHSSPVEQTPHTAGVDIVFNEVSVLAAGHTILRDISVRIGSGEHVAIVGKSGAGKSSLVGLLLDWGRPASGSITVDGLPLDAPTIESLRRRTVWVDPSVQIWNRTLMDNISYGMTGGSSLDMSSVIDESGLSPVLKKLPNGLQTMLGEGGALVSGGEGQRVRLARGMMRPQAGLVILDEGFRGIDREQRSRLLANARALWSDATLLYVTHDAAEAADFDRVIVVEDGCIAEDDKPAELLKRQSRYRAMLDAEQEARAQMTSNRIWRRLSFRDGSIEERQGDR